MSIDLHRRTFLTGTAAAAGLAGAAAIGLPTGPAAADDDPYGQLRQRWYDATTGGDIDATDPDYAAAIDRIDAGAKSARGKLDTSADRTQVFTDVPLDDASANVTTTYKRLSAMTMAYVTGGAALHGDADLLDEIVAGLATVHDNAYNGTHPIDDNWWDWQIGSPKLVNDICVLLYDKLPDERIAQTIAAIDHFVPDPTKMFPLGHEETSTGANRVDECQVVLIRGILDADADKIVQARDALSDVFAYVTSGDGFYRDGSFVQHTHVAYTGTYGLVLLGGMAGLLSLLAGSQWEVTDPNRQILYDAVQTTYAPVVFDDQMMDTVRGRSVSRSSESEHSDGHNAVLGILLLASGVDADTAAGWRAMCAGWLDRDAFDDPLAKMSVPEIARIKQLRADTSVKPKPEPVRHNLFAQMDRAVHRRDGWAYAIAMCSERIAYYEYGNGENVRGWHQGEGMGYLYLRGDNAQFADEFWPTVDPYRLPGTTVDSQPLADGVGGDFGTALAPTSFAGGAVVDDTYAVIGQDLAGFGSTMRARKSWFCLDGFVVALGGGITGGSGHPVESIVENRNLHKDGTNTLRINGLRQPTRQGWSAEHRGVRWAHLDDVAGYVFLGRPARLQAMREERTGRWRDINSGGSTSQVTRRYVTLWLDHGSAPDSAHYAYLLAPGASMVRTAQLAIDPGVQVVANGAAAQAIRVPRLGLLAANLFTAGTMHARGGPSITVDAPASVLLRAAGRRLSVSVADPTHHADRIRVRVGPHRFVVDTSAHDGATHTHTLR